jgi:hypothetical protein
MPNVNLLEAANNLIKAAATKRDEKNKLLAEADRLHRDIEKQVSEKQLEFRRHTDKATKSDTEERERAKEIEEARRASKEMDDLKKHESHRVSELQQAAQRLEQDALGLESEAKRLQSMA